MNVTDRTQYGNLGSEGGQVIDEYRIAQCTECGHIHNLKLNKQNEEKNRTWTFWVDGRDQDPEQNQEDSEKHGIRVDKKLNSVASIVKKLGEEGTEFEEELQQTCDQIKEQEHGKFAHTPNMYASEQHQSSTQQQCSLTMTIKCTGDAKDICIAEKANQKYTDDGHSPDHRRAYYCPNIFCIDHRELLKGSITAERLNPYQYSERGIGSAFLGHGGVIEVLESLFSPVPQHWLKQRLSVTRVKPSTSGVGRLYTQFGISRHWKPPFTICGNRFPTASIQKDNYFGDARLPNLLMENHRQTVGIVYLSRENMILGKLSVAGHLLDTELRVCKQAPLVITDNWTSITQESCLHVTIRLFRPLKDILDYCRLDTIGQQRSLIEEDNVTAIASRIALPNCHVSDAAVLDYGAHAANPNIFVHHIGTLRGGWTQGSG
ncbi:hypothetical protein C8Q74DRAFT_1222712 [Fomes fomentarius]|nr:hypothetical protein C8Q74DRAFT_1222712 [Fomes fomentarius]